MCFGLSYRQLLQGSAIKYIYPVISRSACSEPLLRILRREAERAAFKHDVFLRSYYCTLLGYSRQDISTNQNSHPLFKIDSPVEVRISGGVGSIRNPYWSRYFGKSRLESLYSWWRAQIWHSFSLCLVWNFFCHFLDWCLWLLILLQLALLRSPVLRLAVVLLRRLPLTLETAFILVV
jgi:hypothetical protein